MKAPAEQHRSDVIRSILTIVAIVATFAINAWSNIAPLNGLSIGAIANTLFQNVLIIPANYAFAIWGVIYLGLIAFGFYQFQPPQRANPTLRRVDWLLIGSCLVQAIWVLLFLARQFWLSTVAMIGILLFLIAIYRQLWQAATSPIPARVTRQDR
ncbi:MAG TPA: tryptophan-rich sensory protein, partial [Allocoleopsis sp.]